MIIKTNIITDLTIESLQDLHKLKPFLEDTTLKINKSQRQTVERQELISKRVALFMDDDYILEKMTPLFMKNLLMKYEEKYDASPATMRHLNKNNSKPLML